MTLVHELTPEKLAAIPVFQVVSIPLEGGRLTIYEPPIRGHRYAAGADFAYGIAGRDLDACCVFDKTTQGIGDGKVRQVAELAGRWGERFGPLLYCLLRFYNDAFLVGERQVGLFTLRWLWDKTTYRNLYRERNEATKHRAVTDRLGVHAGSNDMTIRAFRLAVTDRKVLLRSRDLLEQMSRVHYSAPRDEDRHGRAEDDSLRIKLMGGGSPDLVRAAAYGWHAIESIAQFEEPPPRPSPGSDLDVLLGSEVFRRGGIEL